MISVYKIIENTKVEGPGNRFCIWTQGCRKHCEGCWAKDTWDFEGGQNYSVEKLYKKITFQKNIEGVTFLGGEPFEQAQELSKLAKLIKDEGLSVVCFTGYTIEELKNKKDRNIEGFIKNIDLLIDGGFNQNKFDLTRPWVGSTNQRYHFLTNFYTPEILKQYKNKVEAHISQDGSLVLNGMGDFNKIKKQLNL